MKNLLTSETTYALIRQMGLALGHSLWIGAITALLAAAVVVCTRRSRPEIRYNLLTGLLLLFIVATSVAFVQSGPAETGEPSVTDIQPAGIVREAVVSAEITPRQSVAGMAIDFLSQNIYAITLAWLVIVLVKIGGLAVGLYRLHQLKTRKIYGIGSYWERRVADFAQKMGIMQPVRILQSGLVKVPTVLGHFKPVILVPLGVITSIPADQIEMVLLHELAHIRRLDFFVNFVQRLTELLFFFNPGILWISKLIREEREHCCDDLALKYSGNQTTYIRALLSFREYQLNENVYELAFSGKGGLVQRAKRIASRTNSTLGAVEKTVLLMVMLAFFTFSVLFAQRQSPVSRSGSPNAGGQQVAPQKAHLKQVRNPKAVVPSPKNQANRQQGNNQPINFENQSINTLNTAKDQTIQNANRDHLVPLDTLQPLQKSLAPRYQPIGQLYPDSSDRGRLAPVLHRAYVPTYEMQPLKTYQQEYRPGEIRIKRQAINEKIMDAIERQGVSISRNEIDFRITNKELTVNGIKQPATVHKAVLDAVLTKPDDVIDFTYGSHR
ncbi:Signal transducer regulating beta-lactamase production, contains metallopeptidase domain [Dyadobacter sp. SG02]|uniref:M56 family metallopeptidase n=1 Tax=Dyadobacter sp. SG02 TaxID=1855291 RepID=UPI0008D637BE|nr:M56 family metallopeptidase [Dyadobacter sp. SG02]SEI54532.1 Signal transducer regulating beta-lactamase production, contains metallopeptidase domain [Dyadobacter sp. SG02]